MNDSQKIIEILGERDDDWVAEMNIGKAKMKISRRHLRQLQSREDHNLLRYITIWEKAKRFGDE